MKPANPKASLRCAVYTRVSTEHGLEQEFNSLDNQREASEAYIKSQAHEGWKLMRDRYDDGGFSGGSMDRPALKKLLDAVRARRIDVVVVYKVRLDVASVELMATKQVAQRPCLPGDANTSAAGSAVAHDRGRRRDAAVAAS